MNRLLKLVCLLSMSFLYADINSLADGVIGQLGFVKKIIGTSSYAAGLGFLIVTFFKLKQFKDNPQQNPVGGTIMYLLLAVLLMYLGSLVDPLGETLFGSGGVSSGEIE